MEEPPVMVDQSVEPDPRLAFAATLPLRALPRFAGMELLVAVCGLLEGTGVTAVMEPDLTTFDEDPGDARVWHRPKAPPRVGLTVNGITIVVQGHDRPAFSAAELARLDLRAWPEGGARIARARAHVEIVEARPSGGADLDHNYDRAAAVTVVAAAVTGLVEAAAVVWRASRRAVPVEQLETLVAALAQGQAPIPLWLGCPSRPEGARGTVTRGLFPLLGAEIEIAVSDLQGDAAFKIAMELAAEILRAGEAPAHGAWLKYDRNTEFSVRHRASGHAGGVPYVVLTQAANPVESEATAGAA